MHVVNFVAPWTEESKASEEIFESVKKSFEDSDTIFSNVDVDDEENEDFVSKHQVTSYPTVILLKSKGEEVDRLEGSYTEGELMKFIQKNLPKDVEIR